MDALDDARRLRRVAAGGPLAPFSEGLRGVLAGQGYAGDTVTDHVRLLAALSGWLGGQGLDAAGLTAGKAEEFLRDRRSRGFRTGVSHRAIAPILGFLRSLGAAPPQVERAPATRMESLLARYRAYLSGERGVSASTCRHYLRCAGRFLAALPEDLDAALGSLSAAEVTGFVLEWAECRKGKAADLVTLPALRSLLRSCTCPA